MQDETLQLLLKAALLDLLKLCSLLLYLQKGRGRKLCIMKINKVCQTLNEGLFTQNLQGSIVKTMDLVTDWLTWDQIVKPEDNFRNSKAELSSSFLS